MWLIVTMTGNGDLHYTLCYIRMLILFNNKKLPYFSIKINYINRVTLLQWLWRMFIGFQNENQSQL